MVFFEYIRNFLLRRSFNRQRSQPLPPPGMWDLGENGQGELTVAGVSCRTLAEMHGTPLLVVHAAALRRQVAMAQQVMKECFDRSIITYSYKTNCIPGILDIMHKLGVGAEVISAYEFWVAESLGVPGGCIVYNGVDKSPGSLARAVATGALINIDGPEEAERILHEAQDQNRKARVGIRLALSASAQFGIPPGSQAMTGLIERLISLENHVDFQAVHFNALSNARGSGYHISCVRKALDFIRMLRDNHGVTIRFLDIGGGYGAPGSKNMPGRDYGLYRLFGVLPGRPYLEPFQTFHDYMGGIAATIKNFCKSNDIPVPVVIIEPGRFLTSAAEFMLASVKSVKEHPQNATFAISDAGRLSHAFPCDFELHEAFLANDLHRPLKRPYTVTGRVCTRSDWLYREKILPELKAGDILAVMDAGAYFSSYAMNFAFPRPEIIAVENGEIRVLRRRESFRHMTGMDTVPLKDIPE